MKQHEVFVCSCGTPEHQLLVSQWQDQNQQLKLHWLELSVSVHLTRQTLWRRLRYAWRYCWGHQCNYGAFEEILLDQQACERLRAVLDQHLHQLNQLQQEQHHGS